MFREKIKAVCLIFTVALFILDVQSFVLKNDNNEGSEKETEHTENDDISRRRHKSHGGHYENKMARYNSKTDKPVSESLESIVLALNTGIQKILEQNKKSDFLDKYAKQLAHFFSGHGDGHKSTIIDNKYGLKPEVVHFNAEKPTKKIELNAKVLSNALSNFLESDTFRRHFENMVRQASHVYRAVQDAVNKNT